MYVVTVMNMGNKFWLRGTTWAFHLDRANQFASLVEAQRAFEKAQPFMAAKIRKAAVIEKI